jgi:hypothetical protein
MIQMLELKDSASVGAPCKATVLFIIHTLSTVYVLPSTMLLIYYYLYSLVMDFIVVEMYGGGWGYYFGVTMFLLTAWVDDPWLNKLW